MPTGGILEPVSLTEFFEQYWEQQPLHIARAGTNPFAQCMSIDRIEDLLSTNELKFPTLQVTQSGQSIPVSEYTDIHHNIVSSRVIDRYRDGGTIVLSHAHKLQTELMQLCRIVQASFMMSCQTNVYLSPASNQGLKPHFDTHDVFILQVSGRKTFNFYAGGASFPTSADRFNSDVHKVGDKTESIALSAGDTLYIPRGVVHDAVADNDEPSLHITLGVYPILMHELLDEVVQGAIASEVALRRSIPQSLWTNSDSSSQSISDINSVIKRHLNEEGVQRALSRLRDNAALESIQNSRGLLERPPPDILNTKATLQLDRARIIGFERVDSLLKLRTFGAVIEFEDPFGAAVEWLLSQDEATPAEIPHLSGHQRTALLEKLSSVIGIK